ncbi:MULTISPECIES: D-alanine--D-alanine ligase [Chryseobacterium]|uniref:D-alanine--D-alanine ligase n=1 Tax=Chryseobacterium camelliae TaxID=1265445 RepID=A0ABU0TCU2_9FLAO|nr:MULTISPECIES: D-alanine--D-alanine ligase [Chryseobacterium]MDT3407317.1 D-alanine-D-alanine ligase [Pseudacidovorax intermedius]MDQ1094894.1 D-alanine-D-alanine ligase [Chryseobacterium camelliae]MDQ1098832.1 D-alanine-D-alanine ligase [Chryseobacterium sp. SORGH_AS_1048]MDR6086183.1 D-alanine-D-alanine ligase [Chryseobacterium sp. SORGH_AS_0909]MDR6130553.1 D-alanine-D-alanine ligase [Chryseobacterium sp. SORGH_AS_1175]
MSKKSVAVVMGGHSDEYVVSLKSGQLIYDSLDRNLYDVYKVVILKDEWYFLDEQEQKLPVNKGDFSVTLSSGQHLKFDVCFNIIHGAPGENGVLQAYWDAIGQIYTGCDFYQSALTFNKKDTLAVLSKYGVPSAKSIYLRKGEAINAEAIIRELGLPVFVKPNQSGSSLGISKVKELSELLPATEVAFKEDHEILIESFLDGMEVSVGVVDFKDETVVLGITEIVPQNEFFDYEAKYEGASEEITPARIDDETRKRVEETAKKAYDSLGMSGFSRSEYILMDGIPYMLEMNTNPGFSPASILPQQARHYGISITDLCGNEVEKALNKNKK